MKKNIQTKMPKNLVLFFIVIALNLFSFCSFGQTAVPMSTQPGLSYTEAFTSVSAWTDNFGGTAANGAIRWKGIVANAGSVPNATTITQLATTGSTVFATSSGGGVQKGTGVLLFLATGTTSNNAATAADFFMDFTGVNAGNLSFNVAQVANGSGDRGGTLKVYYSIDGTTFTELTGTNLPFSCINNVASSATISLSLPAAFNNVSTARLRFYCYNGPTTGTTGSRPKISIDNVTVTATALACSGTPNQGTITAGASTICTGTTTTLTLTGATSGSGISYQWQQSADGSTGWANVSTGSGGTTITYTTPSLTSVTYYRCQTTCSNSSITSTSTNAPAINIAPNPSSGTITGGSSVCVGSTLSLSTTGLAGGTWSPTTVNAIATISGSTGVVTGLGAGSRTFTYTAPIVCGSATTTLSVSVITAPSTGTILPASPGVLVGTSITLTNPTTTGTLSWSTVAGSGSVTITTPGGVATGLTVGTATISSTSTNTCGSSYATRTININPPPPVISSFTPKSGIQGSTVVINGANFDATAANNIVYFGATKATVNAGASTTLSLSVTVPAGALYAPISVTNSGNTTAYTDTAFTPVFDNSGFLPDTLIFKNALILTAGGTPYSGAIGDLNNDGKPDIVVNNTATVAGSGSPSLSVFKNVMTGAGTISASSFSLTSTITSGIGSFTPNNVKLADIDGDGKLDIIAAFPDASYILVYLNTTSGTGANPTFASATTISAAAYTSVAAIRDFDGNGKPDIALSGLLGGNAVTVLPNTSAVGAASFGTPVYILAGAAPSSVCIADLDHDGLPDVATVNSGFTGSSYTGNGITIARNTSTYGSISFGTSVTLAAGSGPVDLAAGDINNDGKNDLVVTNINAGNFSVFVNTSTSGTLTSSSFAAPVNFASGSGAGSAPTGIAVADMNGDGKLDVVVSNNADNTVSMFRNLASGSTVTLSLATPLNFATGNNPVTVTIGDLDADGYPDVVTGNRGGATAGTTNTFTILKNYPLPPIGITSGTTTVCEGASTSFSNTVTTGGGWALTNTTRATISATGVVTGILAGVDTVIYYTTFGSDSNFVYTPITINPLPAPGLSGTATISSGASTTLTFTGTSGDVVYYWNGTSTVNTTIGGTGTSTVSVAPTVTTIYSVTSATNTFGCSNPSVTGVNVTITISAIADTTPTRDDNMAMGNPSGATTSTSNANNYLMVKSQFGLSYNNSKGEANWVSWHLSRAWKGDAVRCDCFSPDATLPGGYFAATTSNYTGTGFDRGHLCPSDDRDGSDTDNAATFVMTNITPQAPNMNQITWGSLESYCRALVYAGNELYIIAGGYGAGGSGSLGGTTNTIAGTSITVPARFFKVIVVLPVGANDVSRVSNTTRVIAVDMPSNQTVNAQPWTYYRTSVDAIEAATGYDFLSNVSTGIQAVVEAGIDNGPSNILAWDFNGANSDTVVVATAASIGTNLDTTATYNKLSRGATAGASTGVNSFRTTGFQNNGISTANTDYFQTKIKAATGYQLSLSSIAATFAGTASFCASPGVSSQFAYSLDGTTYTLIGSPTVNIGTPSVMASLNLSGVTALQNVPSTTPVYLRYYASGQTTTGGWGFYSQYVGNYGLSIDGTTQLEPCTTAPTAVSATLSSGTVCSGTTVSLTGAATSLGVTTYSWSGPNSYTATDLSPAAFTTGTASAGVYTLVATNGCGTTTATTSALTVNTAPTAVSATPALTTLCTGSTLTLTGAATGAIAYSWSGPDSYTSTNLSPASFITNTNSAGVYTLVATNSCGSTTATSAAVTIIAGSPTVAAIAGSTTVVAGSQITLTNATPSGTWASINTAIATINATGVVTGVSAGTDTITYSLTNACGTTAVSYTITVTPAPITIVGWDMSGATSYGTSPLAPSTTGSHITVTTNLTKGSGITASGTAAARAWGGTGWNASGTTTGVTANAFITFGFHAATGYNVSLSSYTLNYRRPTTGAVSGQLQYSINGGAFTDLGTTISYSSTSGSGATLAPVDLSGTTALQNLPSTSTVTFRLVNYGASSATGPWYIYDVANTSADDMFFTGFVAPSCVTAPTAVSATPSATSVCSGTTLTLTAAATNSDSYSWSGPGGFTSTVQNPSLTTSATSAGVYTLVAANTCGSTTATTAAVTIITTPTSVSATPSATSLCPGTALSLTGAATDAVNFSWSGPNGFTSTDQNPAAISTTSLSSGIYTLTATNTCGNTLATTASVTVMAPPAPVISGTATIILGGSTTLTFSSTTGDVVYYSWTGGSNANTTIGGSGTATVTVSPVVTTTYTIDSARSSAGCFAIITGSSATVTVGPACTSAPTSVSASLSAATICAGNSLTLTGAATSSGPTTYSWSGPNGFTSTDLNPAAVTTSTASAGIYSFTATNGCGSTAATTADLSVPTTPTSVSATPSATTLCVGTTLTLTATATGATGYSWSGPAGFSSTLNPAPVTIATNSAGVYSLAATNSCGSSTATTASISVLTSPTVAAISGATTVAAGSSISLTNATPSGTWTSVTPAIATVSATGVVTGVSGGSDSIYYTVTNSCGSASANTVITVTIGWVSLTNASSVYNQYFDGLANTGTGSVAWANNSTIAGWYAGGTSYTVGTGTGTTGTMYSFGTASGNTNRSLGSLSSGGTGTQYYGVRFKNEGTTNITSITVTYAGEQWRNSAAAANSNTIEYLVDATAINSGTWTNIPALTFTSPITGGSAAALNGKAIANRMSGITSTVTVTVAPGHEIWLRNVDIDNSGTDHAMAMDSLNVNAVFAGCAVAPTAVSASASPTTLCSGSSLTLTSTATGATGYSWTGPNGFTSTSQNPASITTGTASAGIYTVVASNACGSTTATTAVVTINTTPTAVSATPSATILCAGSSLTLTGAATSATGYSWSGPNGFTSTDQNPAPITTSTASSGIYTLAASNTCGTTTATTATISIGSGPTSVSANAPASVCEGGSLTLTGIATGATSYLWTGPDGFTSTDLNPAAITATTLSAGIYSLTATNGCSSTSATTGTVTVNTLPSAVSANASATLVCVGTSLTLTGAATGATSYSWSGPNSYTSTDLNPAAINTTTLSSGIYTLTATNTCGNTTATTAAVTVDNGPIAVTATPSATIVCDGATFTLTGTATGATGYSWSGPNGFTSTALSPAAFTVNTASAGIYTLTATNACGNTSATTSSISVNTAPSGVSATPSATTVCSGITLTLTGAATGATDYLWNGPAGYSSTLNPASVTTTTASAGIYTLSASNSCGAVTANTVAITVTGTPTVAAISATVTTVVIGSTVSLTDATASGAWSSGNTAIATVSASGIVLGVSAGIAPISYTVTNSCGSTSVTQAIIVTPTPVVLVGWDVSTMPGGSNNFGPTPLTPTTTASNVTVSPALTRGSGISTTGTGAGRGWGGVDWQNSSAANAVTGNDVVSFSLKANTGYAINLSSCTINYRRSSTGAASGELQYSLDGITYSTAATLSYTVTASSGGTIAPINLSSVAALQNIPSTTTVRFRIANYGGTAAGGTWYIFDVANTTAEDFFVQGSVVCSGTPAAGTAAVTGASAFCGSGSTSLSFTPSTSTTGIAYQWNAGNSTTSSSFTPVAGATTTTYTTPTLTATTYYNVATTCSYSGASATTANATVTINPLPVAPAPITGVTTICAGTNTTLSDTSAGGTWSSGTPAVVTIDASGVVTALSAGTSVISYTVATATCGSASATTTLTVNPLPSAGTVVGPPTVCLTTSSPFTDTASGGVWTSSDPSIASVDASGLVYGISAGIATISYSVTNGCGTAAATAPVTINTSASAGVISGGTAICPGTTTTLTDGISGGTWSSLNNAIATVSATGVVTGVAADTVTLAYTVTTSCGTATATTLVTVNPILSAPPAIAGTLSVCPGATTSLSDAITGGTWTTSDAAIASIDASGLVTGITSGIATITYTITNLCGSAYITAPFTVNPLPVVGAITGSATVCNGSTTTLSDTTSGGVWTSGTPSVVTINSSTGVVSGVTTGTATISYAVTNGCGTTTVTTTISVVTTPVVSPIAGTTTIYIGGSTTLTDTATGGTWTSTNPLIATVGTTGMVTGVSLGTASITYSVANSCGTTNATKPVTVLTSVSASLATWDFTASTSGLASTSTSAFVPVSGCTSAIGNSFGTIATPINSTSPSSYTGASGTNNIGNAVAVTGNATFNSGTSPFISFTLTPSTGYYIAINGISFGSRSTGTGPQAYTVSSSAAGFNVPLASGTLPNTSTWVLYTPTFTGTTGAANTPVTVRIYAYGGAGSAGSSTANWRIDDIKISYTANPNVCSGTPAAGTATITGASSFCGSGSTSLSFTPGTTALGTTYQWAESDNAAGSFTPIAGATSATYTTPTLTDSTYYVVTTTCNYTGLSANTAVSTIVANPLPSIALGSTPTVCQPTTSAPVAYSGASGSPATYNIDWDATANSAGFTDVSGATLGGAAIPLTIPATGAVGVFNGSVTVSNGICTSVPYPITTTVLAYPTATVTSLDVPCVGHAGAVYISGTPSYAMSYMVDSGTVLNATISAGGTYTINTGIISTPHNYTILTVTNPVCTTYVDTVVYVNPTPMQWVGGSAGHLNEWSYAGNWGCNTIPTISDDITIDSTTYAPIIGASEVVNTRNLTMNQGASLQLSSNAVLNVKGTVTNNSTIAGDGRLILNNTTAQAIKGQGTISNLELDNTAGAAVDSGARLVISNTLYITSGSLSTSDSLELASSDTVNTARIAPLPSTNSIVGKVKVDQYVQGHYRRFRFWSHPFNASLSLGQIQKYIDITGTGGASNGFTSTATNAPSAFRLDPYTGNDTLGYDPGWKPFTRITASAADSNKLKRHQGIRLFFRGKKGEGLGYLGAVGMYDPSSVVVKMLGEVNQGPQTVFMQQGHIDPAHQSFNMVGNPYPSPIDIGTVIYNAAQTGNVQGAAFYMFDPTLGAGGNFVTIPIGTSAPIPYKIGANTCFQVRAGHDGDSLNFVESDKEATPDNYMFKMPSDYLTLNVYDSNYHTWDVLHVQFNDNAKDVQDTRFDAVKLLSSDFTFYSLSADRRKLAIDARPFETEKVIPLGITSSYNQQFIIRAENVAIPSGGTVFLHDKLLDRLTELKPGTEYAFSVTKDKATQGDARFELSMKPATTKAVDNGLHVTMTPNPASDDVNIAFTIGQKEEVSVRVMDISGVNVYSKNLGVRQSGTVSVSLSNLAAGIYMVELTAGDKKVVQRLVRE